MLTRGDDMSGQPANLLGFRSAVWVIDHGKARTPRNLHFQRSTLRGSFRGAGDAELGHPGGFHLHICGRLAISRQDRTDRMEQGI